MKNRRFLKRRKKKRKTARIGKAVEDWDKGGRIDALWERYNEALATQWEIAKRLIAADPNLVRLKDNWIEVEHLKTEREASLDKLLENNK